MNLYSNNDIINKQLFLNSDQGRCQIVNVDLNSTIYDERSKKSACKVFYILIGEIGAVNHTFKNIDSYTYAGYWELEHIKRLLK